MEIKHQLEEYRQWQKENPEWKLICDMEDTEFFYVQWNELPKSERMYWVGSFREDPRGAFEEFGIKRCKVPVMCLGTDLKLYDIIDWPEGFCMTVFKTDSNQIAA